METYESKISVWVCREEKLVLGVSKRTTCSDVVKVLLEDLDSLHGLSNSSHSYCIVEKWRGFERILPNKTKILRLWFAWGVEQQVNVKFVLVKSEASLANHGARSAEARVVPSKHSPISSCVTKGTAKYPMAGISPDKQRRIVRKAFRKLDKINKKRTQQQQQAKHRDTSSAEKMETLAHLVLSQDHTICQQVQRITELDAQIEGCEAEVHFDRIKRHGINYVQDTYLMSAGAAASSHEGDKLLCSAETLAKFEAHVLQCEEVVRLREELSRHEDLIDQISLQIEEELNQRWMQRRREEQQSLHTECVPASSSTEADTTSENELLLEGERIKTQLNASLYIGLRLNTDLEAIRRDLELTQEIWGAKEKEMRDLLEKVNILDAEEARTASEERNGHGTEDKTGMMMSTLESKSEWVEQARGLSKAHSGNDDDSDTGLSSLHSQDSDTQQPVWESLV